MKKKILTIVVVIVLFVSSLYLAQKIVMPKYISDILEGRLIAEYYKEETKHDVVFIGDCEVYDNFSPITLYEEYGITSFIRGSAQQLIWQSYYLMEETLKIEKPDVIVFNVLSMKYDEPQNEAYNRMTLDGMKWSTSKYKAIKASMTKEESVLSYLFPLLRYHSRWSELSEEDLNYLFNVPLISHAGYLMRVDVKGVTESPEGRPLMDYEFSEECYKYLDKMVALCQENNVELVLIKAPSLYPYWYDEWDQQMEEYALKNKVPYINFLNYIEEVGLDYTQDTYDMGLHLNLSGTEKLSKYFGEYLVNNFDLIDWRDNPAIDEVWQEKISFYNQMKEDQYRELEQYGYLKSYGARKIEEE